MIHAALRDILNCGHIPSTASHGVEFVGGDPVVQTPYRIGTAGAAVLGAIGIAIANLRERKTARRPKIRIDVRAAAASLRGTRYVRINGKPTREPRNNITGIYQVAEGRWSYLH